MKKIMKQTLAVVLSLMMCVGMLSLTAFAADDHEHDSDGWTCTSRLKLICGYTDGESEHKDTCYEDVLICGKEEHKHTGTGCGGASVCKKEEHTHTDACYENQLTCNKHIHDESCYEVEWTCTQEGTVPDVPTAPCLVHIGRGKVKVVAPTCTEPGKTIQLCDNCGGEIKTIVNDLEFPALGHTPGDWNSVDNETHQKVCEVCGDVCETAPHQFGDWITTKEATETEAGERSHTCTDCGRVETEEIPVTGGGEPTNPGGGTVVIPDTNIPMGGQPNDGEIELEDEAVPLAGLMTRAEFVDYLWRHEGEPDSDGVCTFTDVAEDHEYVLAISWAQANGIAKGIGNNEFAPDDLVTVEQARLFLERYAKFLDIEMPELATLTGKHPHEILDNASEVLAEFFNEELAQAA